MLNFESKNLLLTVKVVLPLCVHHSMQREDRKSEMIIQKYRIGYHDGDIRSHRKDGVPVWKYRKTFRRSQLKQEVLAYL